MLRRENDLAVLRIRLDRRGLGREDGRRDVAVVFEVVVGTGEPVELTRVAPGRLGIPERGIVGAGPDIPVTLPEELRDHRAIGKAMAGRTILWLELPAPSGPLRALAWETMLAPLAIPVLRLPYFALQPVATESPRTIAICASSPNAKAQIDIAEAVRRFLRVARERVDLLAPIHVFTDRSWARELEHDRGLMVHDPRDSEAGTGSTLQNPWTQWMRDQLARIAVDHVHFLCHGFLAADGGAIALAPSPLANEDRQTSRFVGPNETVALLSALGAWSVGYSGPADNYSRLGLRALADAVAEARPGPVLAHETEDDPGFAELGRGLALAIGPDAPRLVRPGPAVLWIHPQRVEDSPYPTETVAETEAGTTPGELLLDSNSTSMLFGPATTAALAAPNTPSWVASSARVLEQAQAAWLSPTQTGLGASGPDPDWSRQAADALRQASGLLEQHVREAWGQP